MENLPKQDNQNVLDSEYRTSVDMFSKKDIVTPTCMGFQKANVMLTMVRLNFRLNFFLQFRSLITLFHHFCHILYAVHDIPD